MCRPKACGSETADSPAADSSVACSPAPWMFPTPGATYAGIPTRCAYPAAFGDLLAALLIAILALVRNLQALDSSFGSSTSKEPWTCSMLWLWPRLPGATLHGPSLVDSRVLGSCAAGDALHHFRIPLEALESAAKSCGPPTETGNIDCAPGQRAMAEPQSCGAIGGGRSDVPRLELEVNS
jgi:hypothetical protein